MRAKTRDHHHRIDALVSMTRLRDPAHYAVVLRVFEAFLRCWEPAVARALPAHGEWLQARSRLPFVRHDLQVLGLPALADPAPVPQLANAAAAWGSVYVMEGSALGGQVITRSLAQAGLHPSSGAAYFHGWGEATGGMWRDARALLERELEAPTALADACDGACRTFDTLSSFLASALHERTTLA